MRNESLEELGAEALRVSRDAVIVALRFMASACARLKPLQLPGATFATDGALLRYDPVWAANVYAQEPAALARDYLHAVLHCVFLHPFTDCAVDATCWDTACDIVVERTITELGLPATRCAREQQQAAACAQLKANVKRLTAEEVYRYLVQAHLSEDELAALRRPFLADDHAPWHVVSTSEDEGAQRNRGDAEEEPGHRGAPVQQAGASGTDIPLPPEVDQVRKAHEQHRGLDEDDIFHKDAPAHMRRTLGPRMANTVNLDRTRESWQEAALELGVQLESYAKLWGTEGANLAMNLRHVTRRRTDYREFLRKFAVMDEHIQINDDEFDYVYYCLGLRRYGNLPLVEPLEYTEARKVRDFVVAIDTSASTKDTLVRRFLEQTYSILHNETSFAARMNVTIIQCDAAVTDVTVVHSRREFDDYLENLQVKGLGGTDFRPVFTCVDDMAAKGAFTNLGGLVYFTDGYGTYPARAPGYDVAFVFLDEIPEQPPVPAWAMKVQLEESVLLEDE